MSNFKGYKTLQSYVDVVGEVAIKKYHGKWGNTDVDWEINMQKAFKSKYSFGVEKLTSNSYKMPRYATSLGGMAEIFPERIRRVLFSLSCEEVCNQLEEIKNDLKNSNLKFQDIHPGNILFCSKEKCLKLTDFYWCNKEKISNLDFVTNKYYSLDDAEAIKIIQQEVTYFFNRLFRWQIKEIKNEFVQSVGKVYNDGSFVAPGIAYHPIDIPGFRDIPFYHKNCVEEYDMIKKFIPKNINHAVDIGCSSGYFSFNLLRDNFLTSMSVYETDKPLLTLLTKIKTLYLLDPLQIKGTFDDSSSFESDVTIWMNNYQWINKEIGKDRALQALKKVIANSKLLFFQASGTESAGTAIVDYFENKDKIVSIIDSLGGKAELINSTTKHGGIRHLFKVEPK